MDPYSPFRPRAARIVAAALALASLLGSGALSILLPQVTGAPTGPVDQASIIGLALAVVVFCYRQATVRATPDRDGVTVRNLAVTRRLDWSEIVSVRFGQGRPWVQLDLTSGQSLAVMAIQRADGARGTAEARRLATLVAAHEPREPA